LWEEWYKILKEVYSKVTEYHHHAESFTPSSEIIKLVHHRDISNDHTRAVNQMSNNPEAHVFAIGKNLSRLDQEIKAHSKYNESVPKTIYIPVKELSNTETLAFNSDSVKMWVPHKVEFVFGMATSFKWVDVLFILKVKESIIHDWKRGHRDIVKLVDKWFVERLA